MDSNEEQDLERDRLLKMYLEPIDTEMDTLLTITVPQKDSGLITIPEIFQILGKDYETELGMCT